MANGTDDYVNKPFGIGELLARIRAASRYHQRCQGQEKIITLGALKIDAGKHEVLKNGVALHLTPKVFDLLCLLVTHHEKLLTHRQILCKICGPPHVEDVQYLRVMIKNLRAR